MSRVKRDLLIAAVVVVLLLALPVGFVACQAWRTATGTASRVFDPDHLLSAYASFHDDCHGVLALNEQIKTAEGTLAADLADTSPDPLGQHTGIVARDRSTVEGLRNQRDSTAQRYNSNSQKWTESAFKEGNLPASIDPPDYTTSCEYVPKGGQ